MFFMEKLKKEVTEAQIQSIINQRYSIWEDNENPEWTEEERNKHWKIFYDECKEIAEKQLEYEDEEFFEINYEEVKATYDKEYFKEEEIKKIARQAIEEKKESLKFSLISHLTNFSYFNELPLEIIFHSFFSVFLKKYPIKLEGKKIFTKIHFTWSQDSGSGKGEAFRELNRIIQVFNELFFTNYRVKFLDGSETIESFYNSFEFTKKGYDLNSPTIGTFQSADALIVEECSYILVEKRGQKQTKAEILLKALEDQPLLKRLSSWNGKETITYPNFVLFASTRPVPELQETLAVSGLLQRTISCFRNIDPYTRKNMNQKNIYNKICSGKTDEDYARQRENLCYEIFKLQNFVERNPNFVFEDAEGCYQLLSKVIVDMEDTLYNSISRQEHQKIAEAFIARYVDKILVLAVQNAILRESYKVSLTDIQNACDLMVKVYKQMCLWIEQSIDENKLLKNRRKLFKQFVDLWFRNKPKYTKEEFVSLIVDKTRYSKSYAYHLIDVFSVGETSLLEVKDGYVMKRRIKGG